MSGPDMALLRMAPSAVVAMDAEGRITALNPAAERLLSTTAEIAIGRPYPEDFGPSLADRMTKLAARARTPEGSAPRKIEATLPDGRRAKLRASAGPLYEDGLVRGFVFVADIPEPSEREVRLGDALRRYVGDQVAASVDARPSFVGVGGTRQVVSVLHADVRGYTTVSEALPDEEVHALLLKFHGAAAAAIRANAGMVDRYVGDAVLALWNAPRPQADHARAALRGALAMRDATVAVGNEMAYGIGVHTGDAVVGNLGTDQYMHYTAIGDTVNIAARLQGAAAAGTVICSAATHLAAGPGVRARSLGALSIKGRKNPVEAFAVEGVDG